MCLLLIFSQLCDFCKFSFGQHSWLTEPSINLQSFCVRRKTAHFNIEHKRCTKTEIMYVSDQNEGQINSWLQRELSSLSEADSDLLSQYVLALLKDDNSTNEREIKNKCRDALSEFIGDHTNSFIEKLFAYLNRSLNRATAAASAPVAAVSTPPHHHHHHQMEETTSQKRKYSDVSSASRRSVSPSPRDEDDDQLAHKRRRTDYSVSSSGRRDQDNEDNNEEPDSYHGGRRERSSRTRYESKSGSDKSRSFDDSRHHHGSDRHHAREGDEEGDSYHDDSSRRGGSSRGRGDRMGRTTDRGRGRGARGRGRGGRRYDDTPAVTGEIITDKNGNELVVMNKDKLDSDDSSRLPTLNTLIVSSIPDDATMDALYRHFKKFGNVLNIMIKYHSHKAFVQYEHTESAKAALHSPDAVLGNRFVQVGWVRAKHEAPAASAPPSHSLILNKPENVNEKVKELTAMVQKKNDLLQQQLNMYRMIFVKIDAMKEMTKEKMELLDFLKQLDSNIKKLQQEQHEVTQKLTAIQTAQAQKAQQQRQPETAKETEGESTGVEDSAAVDVNAGTSDEPAASAQESSTTEGEEEKTESVEGTPTSSRGRGRGGAILRGGPLARGRGAWRGRGGVVTPLVKRSLTLDNRTTTLQVRGVPEDKRSEEEVRKHFEQFGPVEAIEYENASDAYNVKFSTRNNAQKAIEQGKDFSGSTLKFQWKMQPRGATSTSSHSDTPEEENGKEEEPTEE